MARNETSMVSRLKQALIEYCENGPDEAVAVADDIGDDLLRLHEYFAPEVVASILATVESSEEEASGNSQDSAGAEENEVCENSVNGFDDSDEELLQPGDCSMCERPQMKLTRHHLIPKSTWSSIEPRLVRMQQDGEDAEGFEHLRPLFEEAANSEQTTAARSSQQQHGRQWVVRTILNHQTVDLCRPCHSSVHKTHDNKTLAVDYNTLEKLLGDPAIYKFAKWASRQTSGRHSSRSTVVASGRRRRKTKN